MSDYSELIAKARHPFATSNEQALADAVEQLQAERTETERQIGEFASDVGAVIAERDQALERNRELEEHCEYVEKRHVEALERVKELEAKNDADTTSLQNFVDSSVQYRNLAIELGATPDDMIDTYDRKLCETWPEMRDDPYGWHRSTQQEDWAEQEAIEAERDAALSIVRDLNNPFLNPEQLESLYDRARQLIKELDKA